MKIFFCFLLFFVDVVVVVAIVVAIVIVLALKLALVVVYVLPLVLVFGRGKISLVMRGVFFAVIRSRARTLVTSVNGNGGLSSDGRWSVVRFAFQDESIYCTASIGYDTHGIADKK